MEVKPWLAKIGIGVSGLVCLLALIYLIHSYTGNKESQIIMVEGVKVERIYIPKTCEFIAGDGDKMVVQYKGWLKDGKVFDSSYKRNEPFKFDLNAGKVIRGWDVGLKGMCIGEKRRLTVPSDKAYGPKGSPPVIPPDATLFFEVELVGMY